MGLLEDFGNSKTNSKLQSLSNAKEGKLLELFNYQSTGGASTLHYDTPTTQSGAQLQQELSNAVDQQVYTAPDGSKYQEQYDKDANGNTVITKVPFTGQMRDLYIDNTPQGNMKLGLARTDQGGFTGRYDPAMHPTWDKLKDGELAGPMGVTRKDGPLMNITMPHNAATKTEYDVHSNIGQIRNRAAGQGPMTPQDTANFGAGKTEYTTQNAPMWNQDYRDPGTPLLAGTPMPKDAKLSAGYKVTGFKPYENLDLSPIDLTGSETQTQGDYGVKDFITTMSSAANKLGSKFEHGAGEALDTIGKWQKAYDKKHPPKDPNAVGSNWGKSFSDGLQKAGKILKDDAKYGDMLGEIYYKPTNAGQSMTRDVWKELKQGNVVKALDNVTVAGTLDTIAQSLPEMTMYGNPATFVALYGANVADAIKEYQDQNPGQEPSKGRLGAMMIGEAVSMGIEKLAIGRIITPTDMIVKAEGVLASLANKIPAAVLKEATVYTTKKIGGLVEAATWEGGQEVLQEGQRIGTTQYGTGRDLMSEVNIDRLGESFVGGAAAGGGMHGAVETPGTISDVLSGTKKATDQGLTKLAETTTGKTAQEVRTKAAVNDIVKTEVQKRRVEPTEGMSDSDLEVVNDINSQLDTIGQLDPTKPDYQATVNEILQMADATKEHLSTPTVETTPETPEVKTEEKPTETYDEPTSKRLEAAGLSNVLTKEDRESNVRIELIKDGETRSVLDSRKKDLVFDPATMDDTFIESTIAEGVDESTIKSKLNPKNPAINFVNRVLKKLGRGTEQHKEMQTIYNDVKESFNNPKAMKQLEKISPNGKMTPAKAVRAVAIAANAIESAAESEVHIAAMHGQKNPEGARVPGLDVQIGKEYLNSFGLKVAGGSKESAAKYAIYGRAILNYMEQAGMTTTTKKPVALHNEVNEAGVRITDANKAGKIFEPATTSGKSPSAFMQVVQFNRGELNTDTGRYPKVDAVNTFSKLFRPVNYKLPSTEASKEVSYDKSNPISKEHEKIIRDYQALKYHVKPEAIQLLKEIRDSIQSEGKSTDQALTEAKYKRLLGLHHTNAAIYSLSAAGRSINKKKNLIDMLDNIDEIETISKEGFHFTYDTAINDRIHVMETLLEFQGDKFMARQMVTQGEMSVAKGTDEYKMLTDDIAENLPKGMKRDVEYVEGTKSNKWLDTAMKTIEENGGKGLNLTQLLEYTNKLGFSSSFKALSVLQAIYDVRTAKNDVVKTQYMTEADARASGATNTLFNLAGIPKVQKVLDMMGMGFNKVKEAIDPYMVLVKAFKERYSDALFQETFGETLAKLDKAGLDERTLAKSPAMTSIYGQEASNAKKSMAKGIAEKLLENALADYNQNAVDLINEITGKDYVIEGENLLENISDKDVEKIVKYYQDNLTGGFVDSVNHAYPGIAAYREAMSIMYEALDKSKVWDGKIASAVEVLLGTSNRKNRMSVRKLMSLTTRDIEDQLLSYNEMMNNSTSFNVNLQHSVDAALLLMSIRDAMAKYGTKGVMTVHDAFYGDPKILKDIMKFYNHYTIEAAKKYDFLTMAVNELEAIRTDENTKDIDKALNDANKKIKDATGMDIKELYEAKMEYLNRNGGLKVRVLGNSEIDAGVVENTTEEKTPTTKEEVKAHNESTYISAKATLDAVRRAVVDEDVISAINAIDSMKVSKSHKELLEKVQEALYGTEMTLGDKYSGGYNAITIQKSGYGTSPSDKTEMNTDTLVEILAHEVDHAIQLGWMVENPDAVEMKYLDRVVQRISTVKDFSPETKRRVDYILNPKNGNYTDVDTQAIRQVSELISILSNEPKVSEEILNKFGGSKKTILQTISALIKKAYASFKELLGDKSVNDLQLDTDTIMSAIQSLDNNARANTLLDTVKGRVSNSNNVADAKDVHKEKWVDPFASLNDVISKQNAMISDWMIIWGDTMVENMGPPLSKWNDEMKTKYRLYNTAVSMIRTGLYDSDWAKRMHQTLGIAGDTKEVILNKLHKLATDYQQESKQDLIEMERMDRQIKDTYSKNEQIKLNGVFSHTAIVELSRMPEIREKILDGSMKLSEALKEISTKLDAETISKLDEVAHYYVTGETTTNSVNVKYSGNISDAAYMYTTVKALSMIPGSQTMLKEMDAGLQKWMMSIAQINKDLSNEINEKGMGYDGTMHSTEARYRSDYDGHYTMDIHETVMETKLVTLQDLKKTENSSEYEWEVLKAPTEGTMGVIGRRSTGAGYKTGVGLELNRFTNGVMVSSEQSEYITKKLDLMKDDETRDKWLASNSMMRDGYRYRVLLDNKTKVEKMGVMQNAAHSLYRTYIHNKDLVASEAVRREVLENGVRKIESAKGMDILEKILQKNYEEGLKGERTQVHPFLNVTYDYGTFDDLRREYPMIAQHYKTPVGLTTYNDFHKKVQLVQRGVAEELLGHKNFSIFGETENRTAARWEAIYKKIVVLAKQKMVVMNPVKLLNDSITNMGVLSMMDMSPIEIYQGMKQGWNSYHEYSKERTKLVQLKMEARMDKSEKNLKALKRQEEKMKTMDFYDAHEAGFIQSYGTELVVKEFDTISGIQKDIDNVVDKYTHDVDGNPNALFKAIKWWMNAGVNVDEMLYATGKSAKLNGTTVGEELVAVSERLKNKKNDKESVSRYISEVIGAPASEAANYGGAYMVLSDALSKYVLAKHLMKRENPKSGKRGERRLYTKEEAYMKANETFIDYRRNIPSEISALSDYGILMFPAYWMRVQKVIGSLIKYQPLSVALSYGTEYAIGAESLNVVNQNIFSKANAYGGLIHTDPQRFIGPEPIFAF